MSNFIKQADGSYSDVGSIGAKVVDDTEDFVLPTAAPPVCCEDITSEAECLAQPPGCYWYEDGCHSMPPWIVCSDFTSESTCTAAGCYWRDGACHSTPTPVFEIPWLIVLAAAGGIAAIIGAVILIRR